MRAAKPTANMLADLRRVQRTVGLIFAADDLPEDIKEELQSIQTDLEQQVVSNRLVDSDIEMRCTDVIVQRTDEGVKLKS